MLSYDTKSDTKEYRFLKNNKRLSNTLKYP